MKTKVSYLAMALLSLIYLGMWIFTPRMAAAHCDTLDGPVVIAAKTALQKGEVTPVLKWVKKEDEEEIREAFDKTVTVRTKGPAAKELADMYFFETLVRIHRAGEGAPYTGLKPAGTVDPAVAAADKALETGTVEGLADALTKHIAAGIRERFREAMERKKHSDESVEAGRQFIEAYVDFVHYVERLHIDAAGEAGHHTEQGDAGTKPHKH
jgi:hypothetical protein